jgi:glycosyltransferase involved in cell wall biosynthesis
MKIGFEAKRAYHNNTGLGNYARGIIMGMHQYFPQHELFTFNPKPNKSLANFPININEVNPTGIYKLFPSLWRSKFQISTIKKLKLDVYHGLSHELPLGIEKLKTKKIVTIHDLIFEHYPAQYKNNDVLIYRKKFKHACQVADSIIAISEATKKDLVDVYGIPSGKIHVGSNVINEKFYRLYNAHDINEVKTKFGLQKPYFISVGSLIERKNVLLVCEAFAQLKQDIDLVIIGKGGEYANKVKKYVQENNLTERVHFLEDNFEAAMIQKYLPSLYQGAISLLYPSLIEGFGLPVIEAMAAGCPVITSNQSSLLEAGGEAALSINPSSKEEIIKAMQTIIEDEEKRNNCIQKGRHQAKKFTLQQSSKFVEEIYKL